MTTPEPAVAKKTLPSMHDATIAFAGGPSSQGRLAAAPDPSQTSVAGTAAMPPPPMRSARAADPEPEFAPRAEKSGVAPIPTAPGSKSVAAEFEELRALAAESPHTWPGPGGSPSTKPGVAPPGAPPATPPPSTKPGVAPPANMPKSSPMPSRVGGPHGGATVASAPSVEPNGGIIEPAARFSGTSAEPTVKSAPRSHKTAHDEPVSEDAQLFARWEKDGLHAEEPAAGDIDEDEEPVGVIPRTPEQEARRAWLLRFVAALIGFLAVIGIFAIFRGGGQPAGVSTSASGSASALGAAPTVKAPASVAPPPAPPPEPPPSPPAAHKLPVIDLEIPPSPDPATEQAWEWASQGLAANDFKVADKAFAELGKRTDPETRDTARLARALWWISNGKQAEVQPVIADLAANASTPSVRRRARELMK